MPKFFYFFHVDKTMSIWQDLVYMTQLYAMMERKGIDVSLNYRHQDHNFWRHLGPEYFIFSVFRDPISRLASDFCYTMLYDQTHQFRSADVIVKQNIYNINMDNFEKWLHTVHTPNFQAKTFYGAGEIRSKEDVSKNLKRVDLMLRTSDLTDDKQKLFFNYLVKALNLGDEKKVLPTYFETAWFDHVGIDFYHTLLRENNDLLKTAQNLNKIDLDIWNTNDFFPSGLSVCL